MKDTEQDTTEEVIEIGQWKISAEYGILDSPENKTLILEPRLAKLMFILSQNVNSIVSRRLLQKEVWQDVIVNEESLTRAIADLRRVLKQNFGTVVFIETIPKRGYNLRLGPGPKVYALKLRITRPIRYAVVFGTLFILLTFLWMSGFLKIMVE